MARLRFVPSRPPGPVLTPATTWSATHRSPILADATVPIGRFADVPIEAPDDIDRQPAPDAGPTHPSPAQP